MSQKMKPEAAMIIANVAARLLQATNQKGLRLDRALKEFDKIFDHIVKKMVEVSSE